MYSESVSADTYKMRIFPVRKKKPPGVSAFDDNLPGYAFDIFSPTYGASGAFRGTGRFIDHMRKAIDSNRDAGNEVPGRIKVEVMLDASEGRVEDLRMVNKIYEGLAMARPMISGEARAVSQVLEHGKHIYLCERANGADLAAAIHTLWQDRTLQEQLIHNGHHLFMNKFDLKHNGQRYRQHLINLLVSTKKHKK